ncbi:MAG TPA: hypothetical protein VK934_06180 [Fimbriimonas sp.]|nr:hypothetical protein [Fimbriimonas sp.]
MSSGRFGVDLSETFENFLNGCAKMLLWLGALATLGAIALLIFTAASAQTGQEADALRNIAIFQKILNVGVMALGVGLSYLFWGEDILGAIQLGLAAAMYFSPLFLPSLVGSGPAVGPAAGALQQGGIIYGLLAIVVTLADVLIRVRTRVKVGVKADQLKYGKGVKEEKDRQNVFMGKCWQLPYCRKFVRERCPIFHAKRTCWKELVGCMCEEQVIRNAMENRPIPKDELLAANFIPRNNKLTDGQKKERCRTCVIYNEHQRHKYKLTMPVLVGGFIVAYVVLRPVLIEATEKLVLSINKIVQVSTLDKMGNFTPPHAFVEMLLVVFFIIGLTYSMKTLEFLIFRAKV